MRLFVYGSLKQGGENHGELAGQYFLGPARTVPGYTLYSLGSYPGLIPEATDRLGVTGELWRVDPDCLRRLDLLEGVAEGLYTRAGISLAHPGSTETVETYFYARPVAGWPRAGSTWPV